MTSEEDMKRELHEKFERLKKKGNPGPISLQNCLDVRVTPEENIEIRFKDIPRCEVAKEEYEKVLRTALMGGETVYKTLREASK